MTVEGIPGTPGSAEIGQGGYAVFNKCHGIKVVDDIYGQWSESIAKTQMLQALATHPQKLNGVWQQGSMFMGVTQAIQQAGLLRSHSPGVTRIRTPSPSGTTT